VARSLPKSAARVAALWWIVSSVWWAMSDNRIGQAASRLLSRTIHVTALDAGPYALKVLARWSAPVFAMTACAVALGAGIAWAWYALRQKHRLARVAPGEGWRDITLGSGRLPMPVWQFPPGTIEYEATGDLGRRLRAMTEAQRALFAEVLSVLASHREAYVGEGHMGDLLTHTLNVLRRLPPGYDDPLLPIAAAAHDLGKIMVWRKESGRWRRMGWHDDASGMMLAALPSAWRIPREELECLVLALRYAHKRNLMPLPPDAARRDRLQRLAVAMDEADHRATAVEKEQVRETLDAPAILRRAFLAVLPTLEFQVAGIRKGRKAAGWRKDSRVFLSEIRLREAMLAELERTDPQAAAAWSVPRPAGDLAPITADLIAALGDWVVRETDGMRSDPPLWNVKSGNILLRGVLILDLPSEHLALLPGQNAPYELAVSEPLFPPPGTEKPKEEATATPAGKKDPAEPKPPPEKPKKAREEKAEPKAAPATIEGASVALRRRLAAKSENPPRA
jgi:hypothetical protein